MKLFPRSIAVGLAAGTAAVMVAACGNSPASSVGSGAGSHAPLFKELPKAVQKAGVINVGTSVAYPPYDFNTAQSQKVIGFDPDLDVAIAKLLGVKLVLHVVQFPTLVTAIQSGRFLISIDGVTDTFAREKIDNFVDYGQAGVVILATAANANVSGLDALCGKTLAYALGTYGFQTAKDVAKLCKKEGKPAPIDRTFPDAPSIQLALESGRVAFELEDTATGGYDAKASGGKIRAIAIKGFSATAYNGDFAEAPFGVLVPKNQPQLEKAIYDAFAMLMKNGTYQKILAKWGVSQLAIPKPTINKAIY